MEKGSAVHFRPEDNYTDRNNRKKHAYEFKTCATTVVSLDAATRGLGNASCGPEVMDKYELRAANTSFRFFIIPLKAGVKAAEAARINMPVCQPVSVERLTSGRIKMTTTTKNATIYYSIDGGAYQVAHMTATGNPDEYVGYITGYEGGSEIDYYVFGADESGHRYTQPVFAALDPHHFTMEAHEPPQPGELIITPDTLWFTQMGQQRQFDIINETNEAVTILDVVPEEASFNLWENTFPHTLQPGETLTVTIDFQTAPGKDTYIPYEILVQTTLGDRIVMGMVLNTSLDSGFVIVGAPVVEFNNPNDNPQEVYIQNRFFGSQIPVKVLSVTENETDYLDFEPHETLPCTVEPADYFFLDA